MDFLPYALKPFADYNQFIVYQLKASSSRPNKLDKIPICPNRLIPIDAHDTVNQLAFEIANEHAGRLGTSYGVGFVFTDNDPFFFIDIDDCILDGPQASWSPIALQLMQVFQGAAIEVSISGRGLHIFGCGIVPEHSTRNASYKLEFYNTKRFVALSGLTTCGDASTEHTEVLKWLVDSYFKPASAPRTSGVSNMQDIINLTDEELIKIALDSKSSASATFGSTATFRDLWEANESVLATAFPSSTNDVYDRSAADMSLAWHLAFWTGKDEQRIIRLMRKSALCREKWDRGGNEDYLAQFTVPGAVARQPSTFKHRNKDINPVITQSQESPNNPYSIRIDKTDYPDLKDNYKPLNTLKNLKYMLDRLGIIVRYNEMSRCREVSIPGLKVFFDSRENQALNVVIDYAILNHLAITRIDECLDLIAFENAYHPIVEGLQNNPWDGVSRLDQFIKTLKTTNDELSHALVKKWMLSAVVAAFSKEGFVAPGVLVLQGKQGIGKTHWIKALDPFNCKAVREGAIFDPMNKDSVITLSSYWIVELGELDGTFRKSDIAKLKAHVTSSLDVVRLPYARKNDQFARRTVYAASVNENNFLVDITGNRRWWAIEIECISREKFDMKQVWAEAHSLVKSGACILLTTEQQEQLDTSNVEFEQLDPFKEKVLAYFNWESLDRPLKLCATQVLNMIGYDKPSRSDATRMGAILKKLLRKSPYRSFHRLPPKNTG
jgi:predicted P-loop ATPase